MPTQKSVIQSEPSPEVKFTNLLRKSNTVIARAEAVFPFDPFLDSITVDREKVDIVYYRFFFDKSFFSVLIKNLKGVHLDTSILFSALSLEVDGFQRQPEPVRFLNKKDARTVRRIILGLIAADKEGIDISQISIHDLPQKLEKIGEVKEYEFPLKTGR